MKSVKIFLMTMLLASLPAFNNCSQIKFSSTVQGTEIGNPMTESEQIVQVICSVLTRCNQGLSESQCENEVFSAPNLAVALGAPAADFSTLTQTENAETAGLLPASPLVVNECAAEISQQACGAPGTNVGPTAGVGSNTGIYQIVPPTAACQKVF